LLVVFILLVVFLKKTNFVLLSSVAILQTARVEEEKAGEEAASSATQTTKDDIARLIHLFKYPDAQVHWLNHYGVLNRIQLDSRCTAGPTSDAANPLSCLAEIYNDYEQFQPQNPMVAYVNDLGTGKPVKKNSWEPIGEEWEELAIQMYDIEPTNLTHRNIFRDAKWMKSTLNDVHKYLFQVFTQYNRSGQRSGDMGEWCSPGEQQRWLRAAFWKGRATNTIVRFPTAMIYSIAVLEEGDFHGIGRTMPKGTGADNSVGAPVLDGEALGAAVARKRSKRGPYKKASAKKSSPANNAILSALRHGTETEAKLSALHLILEFRTAAQKRKAMKQIDSVAYGKKKKKNDSTAEQSESEEDVAQSDKSSEEEVESSSTSDSASSSSTST
jgi:hypothetical protein